MRDQLVGQRIGPAVMQRAHLESCVERAMCKSHHTEIVRSIHHAGEVIAHARDTIRGNVEESEQAISLRMMNGFIRMLPLFDMLRANGFTTYLETRSW